MRDIKIDYLDEQWMFSEQLQRIYKVEDIQEWIPFSDFDKATISNIRDTIEEQEREAIEALYDLLTDDSIGYGTPPSKFIDKLLDERESVMKILKDY